MKREREVISVLWAYRAPNGHVCGPYGSHKGFDARAYCSGMVDAYAGCGSHAQLLKVERVAADFATTGRNWTDEVSIEREVNKKG